MTAVLASFPLLMLLCLAAILALCVVMAVVTWSFDLRRSRLPQATKLEDLEQKLVLESARLVEKQAELQELERKIQDRDRLAAEAAALRDLIDTLKAELAGMAGDRHAIEELKGEAAQVAEEYAQNCEKRDAVLRELKAAEQATLELERRAEALHRELEQQPENIEELRRQRDDLKGELDGLQGERVALLAARQEATELATHKASLQGELEQLQAHIPEMRQRAEALRAEIDEMNGEQALLLAARQEREEQAARRAGLLEELARLERLVAETRAGFEADQKRREELVRDIALLHSSKNQAAGAVEEAERKSDRLQARQAALEEEIRGLLSQKDQNGTEGTSPDGGNLDDLKLLPQCLRGVATEPRERQIESDALENVVLSLKKRELKYSDRALRAFHTALKINDISQMTVLAGVSGTGKSLLPRCYAEAMGIHFLQIAVEPRWDSPQDLLGFYNYVEQKFRATELARALVQMDPFNTSGLAETPFKDHVLLVLLDEMNLARVEYYFSEFLSRLEVRPARRDVGDESKRRDAWLPVDIRGANTAPINLFPSHNVLFVGTMNDDESTQSLSDKVLDRANVMQFAAPKQFAKPSQQSAPPAGDGYRSVASWESWIYPADKLQGGERAIAEGVIQKLAAIMEEFGRPFGHRLNEAMLTYAANYPLRSGQDIAVPLADQIEFRILPKLRGISIEEHRGGFDQLEELLRGNLRDGNFSDRLQDLVDRQGRESGLFNWRGLERT